MADNVRISPMRGVAVVLQDAASADEAPGTVIAIPESFKRHTLYIKGSTGTASGAVQPESADEFDYAGTWAPVGGSPVTVVDGEVIVNFEGVFKFFRCRISTVIGGGTVTVTYVGGF